MSRNITIWSFADVDRSGKVRWTANELGYEIEEKRIQPGQHGTGKYAQLNPYAQVPTAEIEGQTMIESTAICIVLANRHPEAGLIPRGESAQASFWQSLAVSTTTLEMPVVNYFLSKRGLMPEPWANLVEHSLQQRLAVFADQLPEKGFLCGSFSLADICAGYVLRVAIQGGLLAMQGKVGGYMRGLMKRPAAISSRIFASIEN